MQHAVTTLQQAAHERIAGSVRRKLGSTAQQASHGWGLHVLDASPPPHAVAARLSLGLARDVAIQRRREAPARSSKEAFPAATASSVKADYEPPGPARMRRFTE